MLRRCARRWGSGLPEVAYIGLPAMQARAMGALAAAVGKAAEDLQGRAQAVTPVATGTLKASIHVEGPDVGATSVEARVATGGESSDYAIFVHEGTGPHVIEARTAKALSWPGADHPVKRVNHPGTQPHKFLERPLLTMTPVYLAYIQAAGREAF